MDINSFHKAILAGIPEELPQPKSHNNDISHAPRRKDILSNEEKKLYGQNRIAEGKVPLCSGMCATKALLAGDANVVADVYRERVFKRGSGVNAWGWSKAYKN